MPNLPLISDPAAKRAILSSLLLTTLSCGTFVLTHWLARGNVSRAVLSTAALVAALIAVHVAGYRLYRRQPIVWSPLYWQAVRSSLPVQLISVILFSMILMSGIEQVILSAWLGFWAGVAIIVCRRPESPREDDLQFIKWGFPALIAIELALVSLLAALGAIK